MTRSPCRRGVAEEQPVSDAGGPRPAGECYRETKSERKAALLYDQLTTTEHLVSLQKSTWPIGIKILYKKTTRMCRFPWETKLPSDRSKNK